jgi:hypothetical protein
MRLRRLCLEIFALRRFFREPIAELLVWRASEAQRKHRLPETANVFARENGKSYFPENALGVRSTKATSSSSAKFPPSCSGVAILVINLPGLCAVGHAGTWDSCQNIWQSETISGALLAFEAVESASQRINPTIFRLGTADATAEAATGDKESKRFRDSACSL